MQLIANRSVIQPVGKQWSSLEEIVGIYSPALPEPQVNLPRFDCVTVTRYSLVLYVVVTSVYTFCQRRKLDMSVKVELTNVVVYTEPLVFH